jgi:hypothetical protein
MERSRSLARARVRVRAAVARRALLGATIGAVVVSVVCILVSSTAQRPGRTAAAEASPTASVRQPGPAAAPLAIALRDARLLPTSYSGGDCVDQVFYASVTIAVTHGPVTVSFRWSRAINGRGQPGATLTHTFPGSGAQSFEAVWRETGISYDAVVSLRLDLLAPATLSSPTLTVSLTCTT